MARPVKRGVRKKEKLKAHGRMTAEKFGRVMGEIEACLKNNIKINKSDIARRVGLTPSRVSAVSNAGGLSAPPTQPHVVVLNKARSKAVSKRREVLKCVALGRTVAEDGTVRPVCHSQEQMRKKLPSAMRPKCVSTVCRDLKASGVKRYRTVDAPCLGPAWKTSRKKYCASILHEFPKAMWQDKLIVTDETSITMNNKCVASKFEYRTEDMKAGQRRVVGYPKSIMVWFAIGKKYRHVVVHPPSERKRRREVEWKTRTEMVQKKKMKLMKVSPTRRYTKTILDTLSHDARREYLMMEEAFLEAREGGGVNTLHHCKRCLEPLARAVKDQAHVVLQDNASIHNSNFAHVFMQHHKLKFIEGHPASSCDLNPAEFMCARLKQAVALKGPSTFESFLRVIEKEFYSVPQWVVDRWVDTYWTRLEQCKKCNGEWVGTRECRRPRTAQK